MVLKMDTEVNSGIWVWGEVDTHGVGQARTAMYFLENQIFTTQYITTIK